MGRAFEYRKASKFARWDRMAKEFTKAGRQIAIAVKQGGPDADTNHLLRRAIQNAKGVQMPKDRIEAAIKKASDKDTSNYDEVSYEGMASHGVAIIVEAATDNPTRTVANVRSYFKKKGGQLGTNGMHDFLFDRKGVFFVDLDKMTWDAEELELELIDNGLEEMKQDEVEGESYWLFYSDFQDFGNLQSALEERGMEIKKSEVQRIPKITKELNEEQLDEVLALVDLLEEDDDVQAVYHNLA